MDFAVKATFDGETHRLRRTNTAFDELATELRSSFAPRLAAMRISYEDDEGDCCIVGNDQELAEAVRLAGTTALRVNITALNGSGAPQGAPQASITNTGVPAFLRPLAGSSELWSAVEARLSVVAARIRMLGDAAQLPPRVLELAQAIPNLATLLAGLITAVVPEGCARGKEAAARIADRVERFLTKGDGEDVVSSLLTVVQRHLRGEFSNPFEFLAPFLARGCPMAGQSCDEAPQAGKSSVHEGVVCDGCNGPIVGVRYKCTVCADFDFCETCGVNRAVHPHTFIKLQAGSSARHPNFGAIPPQGFPFPHLGPFPPGFPHGSAGPFPHPPFGPQASHFPLFPGANPLANIFAMFGGAGQAPPAAGDVPQPTTEAVPQATTEAVPKPVVPPQPVSPQPVSAPEPVLSPWPVSAPQPSTLGQRQRAAPSPAPRAWPEPTPVDTVAVEECMARIMELGFNDDARTRTIARKWAGNVNGAINELLR